MMGDTSPDIAPLASAVLMVLPSTAFANPETAADNAFQFEADEAPDTLESVWGEVTGFAGELVKSGVRVVVHPAIGESPDAMFPNNWFSTHEDGTLCLYPLRSTLRRSEREDELIASLEIAYDRTLDYREFEEAEQFLEGTGSLVLDRLRKIAYASESPRTDLALAAEWAGHLGYRLVSFRTRFDGMPVYHTNVLLALGEKWAVVCEDVIDEANRGQVLEVLADGRDSVIVISMGQMADFCGNIMELQTASGPILVMSTRAWAGFSLQQKQVLRKFGKLIHAPLENIEKIGGGSARCMLAELVGLSDADFNNLEKIVPGH